MIVRLFNKSGGAAVTIINEGMKKTCKGTRHMRQRTKAGKKKVRGAALVGARVTRRVGGGWW